MRCGPPRLGITPDTISDHVGEHQGWFDERPLGTESVVLTWQGQLVTFGLPTSNPLSSMTKLRHVEGGTFQRERSDGSLAEAYVFEEGDDGVMHLWVHGNYRVRVSGG